MDEFLLDDGTRIPLGKSPVLEKLTQSQLIQMIHGYQNKIAELEKELDWCKQHYKLWLFTRRW